MSISGRCRLYGLMWWIAALILAARARPFFGPDGLWMDDALLALGIAAVIGLLKGASIMRAAARRARGRIIKRGATAPPWSIFEPQVVMLIGGMMALGFAIRLAPYPEQYRMWAVGILYPGVALALIVGSAPLLRS